MSKENVERIRREWKENDARRDAGLTIPEDLKRFIDLEYGPYEDRRLSNVLSENINGKINTYLNISKGISNFRRFRKRILLALNPKNFYSITDVLYSDKRQGKKRGPYKKTGE